MKLDKEKKAMLLRWLKNGVIDDDELDAIAGTPHSRFDDMTIEELEAETERLYRAIHGINDDPNEP